MDVYFSQNRHKLICGIIIRLPLILNGTILLQKFWLYLSRSLWLRIH